MADTHDNIPAGVQLPPNVLLNPAAPAQSLPVPLRPTVGDVVKATRAKRKHLPAKWREIITASVMAGRRSNNALSQAIGVPARTFQRWRTEIPELNEVIAAADSELQCLVVLPALRACLATDPEHLTGDDRSAAIKMRMDLAARLWPAEFSRQPTAPIQVNTQVNVAPSPVPQPMSMADYTKLLENAAAARTKLLEPPK